MKISTKGRYALRLMLDLAVYDTGDPVRIKDIAARQEISEKYLEQIISILNKAGYVKSIRGPQGGYHLMKDPAQYTVGMILRLTEGSLAPVACLEDEVNACERQEGCVTLRLWQMLNQAVSDVVDRVTLAYCVVWHVETRVNYIILLVKNKNTRLRSRHLFFLHHQRANVRWNRTESAKRGFASLTRCKRKTSLTADKKSETSA